MNAIDNLRIVKNAQIPSQVTSDVDELVESSMLVIVEIHVYDESTSDIQNAREVWYILTCHLVFTF